MDGVNVARRVAWEYFARRAAEPTRWSRPYPVLKRDYPLNEKNLALRVDEKESPYTEIKRFDLVSRLSGGRALADLGTPELSPLERLTTLKPMRRRASRLTCPIRYSDLAPWYDHVERHAGISGSHEGAAAASRTDGFAPLCRSTVAKNSLPGG